MTLAFFSNYEMRGFARICSFYRSNTELKWHIILTCKGSKTWILTANLCTKHIAWRIARIDSIQALLAMPCLELYCFSILRLDCRLFVHMNWITRFHAIRFDNQSYILVLRRLIFVKADFTCNKSHTYSQFRSCVSLRIWIRWTWKPNETAWFEVDSET